MGGFPGTFHPNLKPRTNGKNKPVQTKSHKETYTHTLTKREKGKKVYIYIYKFLKNWKRETNQ